MSNADRPKPLSAEEARQLTEHLAVLANAGVPSRRHAHGGRGDSQPPLG